MPTKLNIPLPSKGLVVDRPGEYVDARSSTNNKNMETNRSEIRKRWGSTLLGGTISSRVLRHFELQVGATTRLIRVSLDRVEDYNQGTNTWAAAFSIALNGSDTDTVDYAFPLLAGEKIAVFSNAVDVIKKISITGNDDILGGSPPKCKFLQAFGPYLVLGYVIDGGNTYYSRVQWCDTGDPETWSGGNAGSVDLLEDPEDITGLGVFGNFLTVHKDNSIYVGQLVTTSDVFRFDRKATGVGTCAGASIANLPSGEQIFLASDGIHLFNGITAPLIDSPIQDELRESMNAEYLYRAQGVFVEELDEYQVGVPIGNDENISTIYKYNWRTKQIYKDYREGLSSIGLFTNTQNLRWSDFAVAWSSTSLRWNSRVAQSLSPVVVYGDIDGLTMRRKGTTNDDNSVAVESIWETKDFTAEDFGIPDIDTIMRWKGLRVWAKGDSVKVYYSTDGGSSWTLPSSGSLALSADYPTDTSPLNVYFDVVSSRIRFRFLNNVTEESFTLKKYQIPATKRETVQ